MGGPRRPRGEELRRRIDAWGDEWRAAAGSTELADRPRAEAAITELYATDGRPAPAFRWVPSPAAGMLAYRFATATYAPVRGRWARGDVGNGENQPFNALAVPFGMEPAWVTRTITAARDRLAAATGTAMTGDVLADAGRLLGVGDTRRAWPFVRAAADAGALNVVLPPLDPGPEQLDAAQRVLGEAWPQLAALVGDDLARAIVASALQGLVEAIVPTPRTSRWGPARDQAIQAMQPGQWDAIAPVVAAARDVLGGTLWRQLEGRLERTILVDSRLDLARSAGPWWALDGLAIVSERPIVVRRDDRARFHAPDGPAVVWADGTELFASHGIRVDRDVILHPETITVEAIDNESNAELRRVLVEQFGAERLMREGGARLVDEDETGRLWLRQMEPDRSGWWGRPREEDVVMVEVVNATSEPDGTRRRYWLRVPPRVRTAREAVAWTFGMAGTEYAPERES